MKKILKDKNEKNNINFEHEIESLKNNIKNIEDIIGVIFKTLEDNKINITATDKTLKNFLKKSKYSIGIKTNKTKNNNGELKEDYEKEKYDWIEDTI